MEKFKNILEYFVENLFYAKKSGEKFEKSKIIGFSGGSRTKSRK